MKGMLKALTAVAMAAAFTATTAQAQAAPYFGVAGTGMFSPETGGGSIFGGSALVGFGNSSSPLGFRVDGTVLHKSGVTPIQGMGGVTYTFQTSESSKIHPYLIAQGGVYHTSGFTKPTARAGAGFDYMLNNVKVFAEPTFNLLFAGNGAGTQKSLQVNVGVKFGR
jgi:hypothetical protein